VTRVAALALAAILAVGACSRNTLPPIAAAQRVFVIVMENHSPDEALQGAYTAELAKQAGVAGNYHGIAHPSVPNYLALTSGQTWGITDDVYQALPRRDLGDQLTAAHVAWKAYMEGLDSGGCLHSPAPYDSDHNPFAYYGGGCPENVVPFSELASDLATKATRFAWIGPDLCHDGHNCPTSVSDGWLRQTVGMITSSPSWDASAVLFITWDENDGGADNRVLTLVLRPDVKHRVSNLLYDHYSMLATIEQGWQIGCLAFTCDSANVTPMSDLVGPQG
jgi:phospholipase C